MSHRHWDIDEYNNRPYSYVDNDGSEQIVFLMEGSTVNKDVLIFLNEITNIAQKECRYATDPNLKLFSSTKHFFYEISNIHGFEGLNKPKNVHECLKAKEQIGTDGTLRAHERYVMLALQGKNRKQIKELYIHEIAHTLANHVLFRPDDHREDFLICQQKFSEVLDSIGFDDLFNRINLNSFHFRSR